jgi:hypothetical protein
MVPQDHCQRTELLNAFSETRKRDLVFDVISSDSMVPLGLPVSKRHSELVFVLK